MTRDARASAATRLVVPVPELVPEVLEGPIRRPLAPAVVLLDPFLPADQVDAGVLDELGELFGGLVPFVYDLGEPARFPDGAAYLPPQPVTAFRRLAQRVRQAFPEVAAYASRTMGTPHLPLTDGTAVPPTPLTAQAREAQLRGTPMAGRGEQVLGTFAFGTSAA